MIIAVIILAWVIRRRLVDKKPKKEKVRKKLSTSYYAIIATGVLTGAGSVLDPTFLASISLAAQSNNLITIIAMHTVWIIVSQVMLFALFIAYLNGKHEKVIAYSRAQYRKHKAMSQDVLYMAAVGAVFFLISDAVSFLVTGEYLINI